MYVAAVVALGRWHRVQATRFGSEGFCKRAGATAKPNSSLR